MCVKEYLHMGVHLVVYCISVQKWTLMDVTCYMSLCGQCAGIKYVYCPLLTDIAKQIIPLCSQIGSLW